MLYYVTHNDDCEFSQLLQLKCLGLELSFGPDKIPTKTNGSCD